MFSSAAYAETIGLVFGRTVLEMDEPEHRSHRSLVAQAFREQLPRTLEARSDRARLPRAHRPLRSASGRAELVSELTSHFPVRVIARILGLPDEDFGQFHRWANDLFCVASDPERGLEASADLREYFAGIVADRRRHPRDDVVSDLVEAEIDGERLEDEAIYSFLRILLTGGADTTYRASGSTLFLLLTHPRAVGGGARRPQPGTRRGRRGAPRRAPGRRHLPHRDLRRRSRRRPPFRPEPVSTSSSPRRTTTRLGGRIPTASTSSARTNST